MCIHILLSHFYSGVTYLTVAAAVAVAVVARISYAYAVADAFSSEKNVDSNGASSRFINQKQYFFYS